MYIRHSAIYNFSIDNYSAIVKLTAKVTDDVKREILSRPSSLLKP